MNTREMVNIFEGAVDLIQTFERYINEHHSEPVDTDALNHCIARVEHELSSLRVEFNL